MSFAGTFSTGKINNMPRRKEHIPISNIHTFQINRNSKEPLYREVYFSVVNKILTGQILPGAKLPSTRQLAKELGISRNTVKNAFEQLWVEGFVEFRQGSGTYITEKIPDVFLHAPKNKVSNPKKEITSLPPDTLSSRGKIVASAPGDPWSNVIPFAPGIPALDQFPIDLWSRLMSKHWRFTSQNMLNYSSPQGYLPLREAIADYLRTCRAVNCTTENIIIVSGAQQALDLVARILLDPGDTVWMEEPGYHGSKGAFLASGANLAPVPMDKEGMNLDFAKKNFPQAKLVYLTPSHQYPTGVTMSLARRLDFIEYANQNNMMIIEDDYDSEYRYQGTPEPAMQGVDTKNCVIYLGTFSKVLFPSLRIGYLVLPDKLLDVFTKARYLIDRHSPCVTQSVLNEFIREGHFSSHVRKMRLLYHERQNIMKKALEPLEDIFDIPLHHCGMHIVLYARNDFNDKDIIQKAQEKYLQVRALSSYYIDPKNIRQGLVLGYAGFDEYNTLKGIKLLKEILQQEK